MIEPWVAPWVVPALYHCGSSGSTRGCTCGCTLGMSLVCPPHVTLESFSLGSPLGLHLKALDGGLGLHLGFPQGARGLDGFLGATPTLSRGLTKRISPMYTGGEIELQGPSGQPSRAYSRNPLRIPLRRRRAEGVS